MIKHVEEKNEHFFYIGNEKLSCILKIAFGKAQLLHLGAPLGEGDFAALGCENNRKRRLLL